MLSHDPRPDDEPSPHAVATATRHAYAAERLSPRRLKPAVLKELTPKHKLLAEYMVSGCPTDRMCDFLRRKERVYDPIDDAVIERQVTVKAGEPLTLLESAMVLGIRARQARDLAAQPIWHKYHAGLLQAFREGHKAEALREVVKVMRDDGEGKAADRKVKLTAASMLLGDAIAQQGQTSVNVQVGVAVQTPGYVIDLSGPDLQSPEPARPASPILDVTPNRGA